MGGGGWGNYGGLSDFNATGKHKLRFNGLESTKRLWKQKIYLTNGGGIDEDGRPVNNYTSTGQLTLLL